MADRVNASITIGGLVHDLEALVDAIEHEDLGPDWHLHFDSRQEIYDHLAGPTQPVFLARHEVAGGSFDVLQAECEAQQLTYLLEYDGYGGSWGPGVQIFEPGSGTRCYSQESDGGPICIDAHGIRARDFESVQHILDFLDEAAKFEPPPLTLGVATYA